MSYFVSLIRRYPLVSFFVLAYALSWWPAILSKIVLRTLGLFNPVIHETIEMRYEFDEPFVLDTSDFIRTFGDLATPLREAIERTVRWYREERPAGT